MEHLGKYQILGELGRGGMGVVYLAVDPDLGRKVALKLLQEVLSADPEFLKRLEHEARSVAQLFHPHILPINAMVRDGDRLMLEMPYIETGSLADLMTRQGLHCPGVVAHCADILDALAACHAKGIVHRDVKPSNILIDPSCRALLTDFGLAKAMGAYYAGGTLTETTSQAFVGTPRYAPLEAWDAATPSPAWDLYSIGVILYEGLSGRPLIESDTLLGYLRAVEQGGHPRLKEVRQGISEPMEDLVERLLAKDPGARPESAGAVLEELKETPEFQRAHPASDITISRPVFRPSQLKIPPAASLVHRHRRMLTVLVLLLLLGVTVLSVSMGISNAINRAGRDTTAIGRPAETAPDPFQTSSLLQHDRTDPPAQAFAVVAVGGDDPTGTFLLSGDPAAAPAEGLLYSRLSVGFLTLQTDADANVVVEGIWGRFTDEGALECISGTVAGTASWLLETAALSMTLTFSARDYALRWQEHLTLTRSPLTDTAALWDFEESDYLVPMIVNELCPRDAVWWDRALSWLPALPNARLALNAAPATRGESMDAHVWEEQTETVRGHPGGVGLHMAGVVCDDGVVLRFTVPSEVSDTAALTLALQTKFPLPQNMAPQWEGTFENSRWTKGTTRISGTEIEWQPTWTVDTFTSEDVRTIEVRVPFSETDEIRPPALRAPWRLNAMLTRTTEGDAETPIQFWGSPDTSDTRHGLMLVGSG